MIDCSFYIFCIGYCNNISLTMFINPFTNVFSFIISLYNCQLFTCVIYLTYEGHTSRRSSFACYIRSLWIIIGVLYLHCKYTWCLLRNFMKKTTASCMQKRTLLAVDVLFYGRVYFIVITFRRNDYSLH